jgi:hypothetical protein
MRHGANKFGSLFCSAQLNQSLGWTLLLASFACSVWLTPYASGRGDSSIDISRIISSRQGYIMMAGMAFLQLTVAQVVKSRSKPAWTLSLSLLLIAGGGLLYGLGNTSILRWEISLWLVISGALTSLLGVSVLLTNQSAGLADNEIWMAFWIFCFGLALETVKGMLDLKPELFPYDLGAEDGLRLRMLRLARISSFALPALACLFHQLGCNAAPCSRTKLWGLLGILSGAIGIPLVLTAASLTSVKLRVLVAIPANAMFAGALAALWLSHGQDRFVETLGWLLVALSMGAGMLMGLYAFDALLQPPPWIGGYNDSARSLLRQAHVFSIVCGLMTLFVSRELATNNAGGRLQGR